LSGNEALLLVIEAIDALEIDYVLVGSYASNTYGSFRAGGDAELVVDLAHTSTSEVFRRLRPAVRFDRPMTLEAVSTPQRYVAPVEGTPFQIELFPFSADPHDRERFRRRRAIETKGRRVYLLTVEDVIVTKLRWARPKDRDDVCDVIAVQGDAIDWEYVYTWAGRHGTRALVDEIRASIPPI
jgi:predicted nucleotidyltransferase